MSKIISIGTSVPDIKYEQSELMEFADSIYANDEAESRKLKFLYKQSGISHRYSVTRDFSAPLENREFFPPTEDLEPFPSIEKRMNWYATHAAPLSIKAISQCLKDKATIEEITHLITVSCTGLSAPGLDLQLIEIMGLSKNIVRTSVNFMGCYAAVHGLKLADAFCAQSSNAKVLVVCTELCTLHFQKGATIDNITSSLLFGDGCSAVLVVPETTNTKGIRLQHFFSDVSFKGKNEMAWEVSSKGFLMTLTGYVPALIKEDFKDLVNGAMEQSKNQISNISHYCIHPGGKQILQSISSSLAIDPGCLKYSYEVLRDYGNMSSATILFVLKKIFEEFETNFPEKPPVIFGAAFGPGLTMETFTATYD